MLHPAVQLVRIDHRIEFGVQPGIVGDLRQRRARKRNPAKPKMMKRRMKTPIPIAGGMLSAVWGDVKNDAHCAETGVLRRRQISPITKDPRSMSKHHAALGFTGFSVHMFTGILRKISGITDMDGHGTDTEFFSADRPDGKADTGKTRRITNQAVMSLRPPAKGNRVVWDRDLTGFGVRMTAAGAISFVLRYVINGRERRYTIGKHPDLSASAARELGTVLRGRIVAGLDPLDERRESREAATVAELCNDYMDRHAKPKKRPASIRADEQLIRLYIKPKLGARKVIAIGRRDLDEIHQALGEHPYQANRLLALLSKMFSLAVAWGWRGDNPAKGVERFAEHRRERWLQANELGALSKAIEVYPDRRIADAIRLLILTGSRRGEVLNATWDQFDLARAVWTKPSHHTKQNKTEHVPLSGPARLLVSDIRDRAIKTLGDEAKLKDFPYLFPGDKDGQAPARVKARLEGDLRRCGLGRRARSRSSPHLCLPLGLWRPFLTPGWPPAWPHPGSYHTALRPHCG